ncbi:3-oxoacyl-ACP reductase (plasmid) [Legionella adelaidensis]|uniref:3-oxoacyl-ACP reductase n=1 Tax=Legionella adelaidensis TaxID=45056 RepID=A0A0W0R3Z1_9GAMM|nr:SDR family NAD(P)-dependent oxidoreductase [Legionella adelaidensis]KTC65798.1 3-oxoacyl-ACP reductase [Legionella adelaidensis]VEH85226.1 3-oxoacyl-ACP reductase [Legionella adelaidensis]
MHLDNQIAVITGGASGIGKACTEEFSKRGLKVIVWDKQPTSEAEYIECDVSSADSVESALKKTIDRLGVPRINVNCAGIAPAKRLVGKEGPMTFDAFKQVIDINLIGTFNVMRVLAHAMSTLSPVGESGERGIIINTASIAAYEGQIGQVAYSASKGGVVAMTLPAARELAQFGIRVNTIAPGLIATPLLLNMPEEVQKSLASSVPFPKRFGKPSEYANLALHLIENSLINGEVIRLDGALRMQPR